VIALQTSRGEWWFLADNSTGLAASAAAAAGTTGAGASVTTGTQPAQ